LGTSHPSVTLERERRPEGRLPAGKAPAGTNGRISASGTALADSYLLRGAYGERTPVGRLSAFGKRFIDIVVATTVLLVLIPFLVLTAIIIKLESPGPVLFRQRRLGVDMSPFRMWKFRTMWSGSSSDRHRRYIAELAKLPMENGNGLHKLVDDPRVTRVGHFLRKTSVDELPQLVNVLLGHMSLTGPRPALDYELEHYALHHFERFLVRPGLTGLWQVTGRNGLGFMEMLDLDVAYARHATFMTDMRILVRTPRAALSNTA
jgi:lipopolysaccharide/colanic/teichoic acid biosynthesis glycosyltransferase